MRQRRVLKGQINLHAALAAFTEADRIVAIDDCVFAAGNVAVSGNKHSIEFRRSDRQDSGEFGGRRAAIDRGTQPGCARCLEPQHPRNNRGPESRPRAGRRGSYKYGSNGGRRYRGKCGTAGWSLEPRPRNPALHRVHRAVVGPLPAAAVRQAHVPAPRGQGHKGRQPEEQNQRNGKGAPHGTRTTIMPSSVETRQCQNVGQV